MTCEPALLACPRCTGRVRPGAPWCTQCFSDLRRSTDSAGSATLPGLQDRADGQGPQPELAPTGTPALEAGGWPCTACGVWSPLDRDDCAGCGLAFLGGPDGAVPPLVLPGVGDLALLSRARRLGLALGLVLVLVALTAAAGALLP